MNFIGDQTDSQTGGVERAPENVVVAVQLLRAGVAEVREASRTGLDSLA